MNTGLLLLHAFVGAALVAHALQKLFVFRPTGTAAYLDSLGFRAPGLMAAAVIGTELAGGTLLGLGLLIPAGAAAVAGTMLVAARTDHRGKGWFITGSGAEFVATNAVIALALAAVGGGRYSLDSALGLDLSGTSWLVAAAVAAVAGAGVVLSPLFQRREPAVAKGVPA
jgi:putative oxidoreductase